MAYPHLQADSTDPIVHPMSNIPALLHGIPPTLTAVPTLGSDQIDRQEATQQNNED